MSLTQSEREALATLRRGMEGFPPEKALKSETHAALTIMLAAIDRLTSSVGELKTVLWMHPKTGMTINKIQREGMITWAQPEVRDYTDDLVLRSVAEAKIAGLEAALTLALPRLEEFLESLEDNDLEPQDAPNTSGVQEAIETIRSFLPDSPVNEEREG